MSMLRRIYNIKFFRNIYRFGRDALMMLSKTAICLIPKDEKLFLFTAWFGEKYSDNTMFMYEHLLKENKYKVVWTTKNKDVYKKLLAENRPVVLTNSVKGMWTQIRAKVLLSTVQLEYNQYLLAKCIYIDLDHGMPFKMAGYTINSNDNEYLYKHDLLAKKYIKYYMSATSYCCAKMMEYQYRIGMEDMILAGRVRHQLFFDETMRKGLNPNIEELKKKYRIISYLPTHRSCGAVPIDIKEIFDLDYINQICKENDCIFLIKKHFYHRNDERIKGYSNVLDMTGEDVDTQMLLYQSDALVSDYSSAFIDYLLLERPIILYMYDAKYFLEQERGFFIPFDNLGLDCVYERDAFNKVIRSVIDGDEGFAEKARKCKSIFFDKSITGETNIEDNLRIIEALINKTYKPVWKSIEKENYSDQFLTDVMSDIKSAIEKDKKSMKG